MPDATAFAYGDSIFAVDRANRLSAQRVDGSEEADVDVKKSERENLEQKMKVTRTSQVSAWRRKQFQRKNENKMKNQTLHWESVPGSHIVLYQKVIHLHFSSFVRGTLSVLEC